MENDLISRSELRTLAYHVTDNIIGVERCVVDWEDIEDAPAVDAVVLSKEDAEFLANLRHELLTQPTDGNCDPRFWGVIEDVYEWGYEEECGEGWGVWDSENCCDVGEIDNLQSVIAELTDPENYGYDPKAFAGIGDPEEIVDIANDQGGGFTISYYRLHREVSEEHLFLTKKACKEYINRYGYNHKNPRTYVMTAERCPEYARLLKILKNTEWRADRG